MLTKQFGNVTVHFEPLIIVIVVILIAYLVLALILRYRGKKITKAFESGNYGIVLIDGEKLLKTYQRYAKRYKHRNTLSWIEFLHFALAVSYFSKSDVEKFLEHINSLSQYKDIKNFWLALFYLQQNDFKTMQEHYNNIDCSEKTQVNRDFIDGVLAYKQGNFAVAKNKMTKIYEKLKHLVLKQIADEILS